MDLSFIFVWIFSSWCWEIAAESDLFTRNRLRSTSRSLIFPVTSPTRIQFIGGIGIPVEDLAYESITSGYVLKAEYFLPFKAEQLRPNYLKPQLIHRRSVNRTATAQSQPHELSDSRADGSATFSANSESQQRKGAAYRWILYRSIEVLLDRSQQPGRICLLRSLCEHAALPLHHDGGLLSEILHIVLTPSTSRDDLTNPDDKIYLEAEMLGRSGANCETEFSECTKSPMDLISTIVHY